jgi:uncharacterized protein (DUF302 family)
MSIHTGRDYDEALALIKVALKMQGFGVLTEIDVKATMAEKLGVEFRRYDIIGACNPPLAHRALSTDLNVGLLLPCNVIVYEADGGGTVVTALDPEAMLGIAGLDALDEVASEAKTLLQKALEALRD